MLGRYAAEKTAYQQREQLTIIFEKVHALNKHLNTTIQRNRKSCNCSEPNLETECLYLSNYSELTKIDRTIAVLDKIMDCFY